MPEEWPIAATSAERDEPARAAGRGRLSTVLVDFFLDPAERLTEQERALMTAMLHCLIGDVAAEIRAALPSGWLGANDDDAQIVESLTRAGLLNDAKLMALLLRAADEQRIGTAARARNGGRDARALQGLVSTDDGTVSAAAMALILARGRRRDRFGQCLVSFDDLPSETADWLVHAIAAALRRDILPARGAATADSELSRVAGDLLTQHDHGRSMDALTAVLVAALDQAGSLTDELLRASAHEGEVRFLGEALGRRAGTGGKVATEELLSGNPARLMALFRIAAVQRDLCASLLASIGDLLGIDDPGAAISVFDSMSPDEVESAASWLRATHSYRAAVEATESSNG